MRQDALSFPRENQSDASPFCLFWFDAGAVIGRDKLVIGLIFTYYKIFAAFLQHLRISLPQAANKYTLYHNWWGDFCLKNEQKCILEA
jgi:hypothetical protein